ncbi:uncharacterized protein CMC5_077010 [Chondromyces crocatus]|uniref:Uncharacterized protein n=1 Tax=Chondromyces crocatus TaxID=52 RepID=A0A0K1ERM1_CHOCO|nr:uncharacterized protein CMC5_077010 [Chondromyces crocatus]
MRGKSKCGICGDPRGSEAKPIWAPDPRLGWAKSASTWPAGRMPLTIDLQVILTWAKQTQPRTEA